MQLGLLVGSLTMGMGAVPALFLSLNPLPLAGLLSWVSVGENGPSPAETDVPVWGGTYEGLSEKKRRG